MNTLDFFLVLVLIVAFVILVSRPVRNNRNWSATVTPLASIIGSGFLVFVPLLVGAVGLWAVAAIAGLAVVSFLVGGAIRYNIRFGEPVIESAQAGHAIRSIEGLSHLVLAGAYFIAVAYYLVLLAAFGVPEIGRIAVDQLRAVEPKLRQEALAAAVNQLGRIVAGEPGQRLRVHVDADVAQRRRLALHDRARAEMGLDVRCRAAASSRSAADTDPTLPSIRNSPPDAPDRPRAPVIVMMSNASQEA